MNPDNHTWDLLVGALKGTLGEAEQREFDRWAAEAENRRFYNNLTRVRTPAKKPPPAPA